MLCAFLVATAALPVPAVAQSRVPLPSEAGTTAVITGQGVVSRPPDMATINVNVTTNDDASAVATARNTAVYTALTAALAPLGVDGGQIKTTYYNLVFTPRAVDVKDNRPVPAPISPFQQRFGYVVSRQMQINVTTVANVGKIVDATVGAGATSVNNVVFGLADRTSANQEALELAVADAAAQANVLARASHMRIAGIKQIAVNANNNFPGPGPMRSAFSAPQISGVDLPPTAVDVRSSVTVTYLLK